MPDMTTGWNDEWSSIFDKPSRISYLHRASRCTIISQRSRIWFLCYFWAGNSVKVLAHQGPQHPVLGKRELRDENVNQTKYKANPSFVINFHSLWDSLRWKPMSNDHIINVLCIFLKIRLLHANPAVLVLTKIDAGRLSLLHYEIQFSCIPKLFSSVQGGGARLKGPGGQASN